jgi:hypothetical protein
LFRLFPASYSGRQHANDHAYKRVELVWPGKKTQIERLKLPFQVIGRVNDVRESERGQATCQALSCHCNGRATGETNGSGATTSMSSPLVVVLAAMFGRQTWLGDALAPLTLAVVIVSFLHRSIKI